MPIKFHPVVLNLERERENSLISSVPAGTEAMSLKSSNPREMTGSGEAGLSEPRRWQPLLGGPWPALPPVCQHPDMKDGSY